MLEISKTAIKAMSKAMEAKSSNIANVNTEGFKAGNVRFQDMVGELFNQQRSQHLNGVKPYFRHEILKEGTIETSSNVMDLALLGRGMFVTSPEKTPNAQNVELTDNGRMQLKINPDGPNENGFSDFYLADQKGNYLLGWPYDAATDSFETGADIGSLSPIITNSDQDVLPATPTENLSITANLPATAKETASVFMPNQFEFSFKIYDGTGATDDLTGVHDDTQQMNMKFTKLADLNRWQLDFSVVEGKIDISTPQYGPLFAQFDALGNLENISYESDPDINGNTSLIEISDENNKLPLTMSWFLPFDIEPENPNIEPPLSPAQTINIDLSKLTQIGDEVGVVTDFELDGSPESNLVGFEIQADGVVMGQYEHNISSPLAKLAVGDVMSMDMLSQVQATHFKANDASGAIRLYEIDKTQRVELRPGSFERSTTDIANEFTDLIKIQRSYSSAATTLKTADEMMQTVTQLR